jgi:hypothetical protein
MEMLDQQVGAARAIPQERLQLCEGRRFDLATFRGVARLPPPRTGMDCSTGRSSGHHARIVDVHDPPCCFLEHI